MILQSLKIALESLWANKMRSFLSMLGIIIGVGAVIAIVSVGTGSTQQITSRIANLGSNMITVYPRTARGQGGRVSSVSSQEKFSLELTDYIEKFCPSVIKVIPVKQVNGRLISGDINDNAQEQFRIISQDEILDTVSSVTKTMSMMLGGIAAISLLVGGIGIMNIMLVSVTERTREIGVRKALGARNTHILFQFLMESLNLTSFGGILGIGFGWTVAYFLSQYGDWPMVIAPLSIGLAFGFALFIGIFFGLYPAMKAAKMNPVDALRYE